MARVSDLNASTRLRHFISSAFHFFGSFMALGSVNQIEAGTLPNQLGAGRQPVTNHRR